MADNTLDILIRFGLSKEKAEEARAEITKLQTATEESGKASVKANEEGGVAANKHTGHIQGLHRAVGFLGRELGTTAGHLSHFIYSWQSLAVVALAVGIHNLTEKIKEHKEALLADAERINKMWEDRADAQGKATTAAKDYTTALGDIYTKYENLKQAEADEIERLKLLVKAWKDFFEAQEKAELLAAGGDKGKEAAIKAKYSEKKSALDIEAEAKEVEVKADTYRKAQAATLAAQKKSDAAQAAVNQPAINATDAREAAERIAAREKNKTLAKMEQTAAGGGIFGLDETLEQLIEKRDRTAAALKKRPGSKDADSDAYYAAMALNERQNAIQTLAEERQRNENDKKIVANAERRNKELPEAAAKALAEEKSAKAAEDTFKHDWDQSAEALRIHRWTRGQVQKIEDFAHPDEIIATGGAAVAAQRAGKKLSDQQKADEAALERLVTELGQHAPTVIAMLKSTTDLVATLNSEVKFAHARISQMAQR